MSKVLDRDLAFEGNAAAPRGVRAGPARSFGCLRLARVSSSQERTRAWSVLRRQRSARPSRLDIAKPASRSFPSAAVAVVGETPSLFAIIRPDMGFGPTARPLKALKAVSSSVARSVSVAEVMRAILATSRIPGHSVGLAWRP